MRSNSTARPRRSPTRRRSWSACRALTAGTTGPGLQAIKDWNAKHPGVPLVMGLLANHLQFVGDRAAALELRKSKSRQTTPAHGKTLAASLANAWTTNAP